MGGSTGPMSKNQPVDPRIRLAISQWPPDAPRGSVSTFCAEHEISRKTFYAILRQGQGGGSGCGARASLTPAPDLADPDRRGGQGAGSRGPGGVGVLGSGPRAGQRARQDARPGPGPSALDRVAGQDLPREGRGPGRAEEEATGGLATVRLSGAERVLAARCHRVRPDRGPHVRDLPARGRPLPARGRLPRRVRGDQRGRAGRGGQGHRRPRGPAAAAVRQRGGAQPQPTRLGRPARWPTCDPWESRRSPASPASPPPRARTNGSTRPCSAGWTNNPWPSPSTSYKRRSTSSTASTTPSGPTKACPDVSPR